jgi:hypothetical protein
MTNDYSERRLVTGLVKAAFIACQLTVIMQINMLMMSVAPKTQKLKSVL